MSGPRRRKFVGPIVSRVTWHGGRGRQRSRWALIIALAAQEPGRPLLEECARAFLVVGALERLDAQHPELLPVRLGDAVEDGLHLGLRAADGQRCIGGHAPEVVVGVLLEIVGGYETL